VNCCVPPVWSIAVAGVTVTEVTGGGFEGELVNWGVEAVPPHPANTKLTSPKLAIFFNKIAMLFMISFSSQTGIANRVLVPDCHAGEACDQSMKARDLPGLPQGRAGSPTSASIL
jgi:hypothetical protein